jgi:hypothetical protein
MMASRLRTAGAVQGLMKGKVFEKVGVNVSTVHGTFSPEFARTINGADPENPTFTATGISLVAHMANPHVPAVHMNTRFLTTSKAWFGGGGDLNPPIPYADDTADFHARFQAACDAHDPAYYPRFKAWADDYFFLPTARSIAAWAGFSTITSNVPTKPPSRPICIHPRRGRGLPRHLSAPRAAADGQRVHAGRGNHHARMARALCRIQPRLRPGHAVRPQDGRQYRRDPDEPAPRAVWS